MSGTTELEKNIQRFEGILEELRHATREANGALKDLKEERRIIEKMTHDDVKKRVHNEVDKVVRVELEKIGPEIRNQTGRIYAKVGEQVDKLINIAMGREFSTKKGKGDLRPVLAAKLREWIDEILQEDDNGSEEG